MNSHEKSITTRREFLKTTGRAAAVSALAGMVLPNVHAAGNETIQIALIGCGGRGTGAAINSLNVKQGPVKLVAMADVFRSRLDDACNGLKKNRVGERVDVPEERKFIGFDAYQKAMDCLKPGDIAIFTTPLAFRWVHFTYAIQKGLNVFMEKPLSADGLASRKLLKLGEEATAKNLKVGVGLMSRHARHIEDLQKRIQDGEIGDIILMRGYRMHGPAGSAFSLKYAGGSPTELLWQIQRFHSFIWASGGCFSDFYIHHIDHLCWMKGAWPVKAVGLGGRNFRFTPEGARYVDQNFDSYSVEYTFADGAKMLMDGRCMDGCHNIYSSAVQGSKGMAIVARANDCDGPSSTYAGQNPEPAQRIWSSTEPGDQRDPYQNEWNELVDAIRNDKPYNEVKRGVEASVTCSMGRKAAHSGQEITFDQMLNSDEDFAANADTFTMDSPPPLRSNAEGIYPIPRPGMIKDREY